MLGITIDESLNWNDFISRKLQLDYSTLTCLRKIKGCTSYHTRKWLAKPLILSKLDYRNVLSHNTSQQKQKKLCCPKSDALKTKCLPVE